MRVVLASGSPRRHELLKLIYSDFEIRVSDACETLPHEISASKTAEYLSMVKAKAVERADDELVIGCDTVVVIDDKVLGKPSSEEDCRKMLENLSGRTHTVYTGVSLLYGDKEHSFTAATEVTFYQLSDKEITDYIATKEPFDKAGGYGIQGFGSLLVSGIKGDYFNVVGLPVARLKREIESFLE